MKKLITEIQIKLRGIVENHEYKGRITKNDGNGPYLIFGDQHELVNVMINLLVNAIKYTSENGKIRVKLYSEVGQVIFEVADNGIGIPINDQQHIFEKFYRGENAPDDAPGTGLGLSIVKSIVENHGGRIWVESVYEHGSKFVVVLPIEND